jgi:hypothetical protein
VCAQAPPRLWLAGSSALLVLLLASAARADARELAVGVSAVGDLPPAGGVDGNLELGLSDTLSLRLALGGRLGDHGLAGRSSVGLTAAWNVLTWVPELTLAAGGELQGGRVRALAFVAAGVRRYFSLRWSLGLDFGLGRRENDPFGFVAATLWRSLP